MGVDVLKEIAYFAGLNRIKLDHFRTVRGTVPNYVETFNDHGDVDMLKTMQDYRDSGFNVPVPTTRPEWRETYPAVASPGTFTHGLHSRACPRCKLNAVTLLSEIELESELHHARQIFVRRDYAERRCAQSSAGIAPVRVIRSIE